MLKRVVLKAAQIVVPPHEISSLLMYGFNFSCHPEAPKAPSTSGRGTNFNTRNEC